ncbi:MAG: alpha/beta-type small acid-soluble spore protein [Clostridia bacterium]|jgi:hypothetical protein|nr:alpha/beta-type small acid-soluble spore protein [Clostridia bacterium]MDD4570897.1 alpha/beta-type small acid-soluble spore protein [Clostridia bacterium]
MNNKNNKALSQFKTEIATELGISNYDQVDKGQLTSRQNGYVGGNMTKKMVAYAEQALAAGQSAAINGAVQTQHMNQANPMNQ